MNNLDLLFQFFLHLWQFWGWLAFAILPAGLAVVAVWDFADWKQSRGRGRK